MLDFIHMVKNPLEDEYNTDLLSGKIDYTLEELVDITMHEAEAISNIKIEEVTIERDMDNIDLNEHKVNINFKKKNPEVDIPKFKYIQDGYYEEMTFKIRITTNLNEKVINKKILVPVNVDGFFIINGKKAKAIWQLCEASVYTQRGKITLKSRMPIIMYKGKSHHMKDIHDTEYEFYPYSYAMEIRARRRQGATAKNKNRYINPMMIFAAKMGVFNALKFMGVDHAIDIVQKVKNDETYYRYFKLDEVYIKVDKAIFDENVIVRSIVGMLTYLTSAAHHPVNWDNLEDRSYWICRLGYVGAVDNNLEKYREKGKTTLLMIERPLDELTRMNLRVPEPYKQSIYTIIRWMIYEFDHLKVKVNIDMNNKRIRRNEAIIKATLGRKLSENINKVISKKSSSRDNNMETLLEIFSFPSSIIVNGMNNLNDIIKPDDMVNDLTILQDMAFTAKGPESLGENSTKNVKTSMRDLHLSMMGKIDLNCTSNSDVGLSGSLTPFVKLYDRFFFSPDKEPCHTMYDTVKFIQENGHDIHKGNVEKIKVINKDTGEVIYQDAIPLVTSNHDDFDKSLNKYDSLFNIENERIEIIEKE